MNLIYTYWSQHKYKTKLGSFIVGAVPETRDNLEGSVRANRITSLETK